MDLNPKIPCMSLRREEGKAAPSVSQAKALTSSLVSYLMPAFLSALCIPQTPPGKTFGRSGAILAAGPHFGSISVLLL